MRARKLMNRRLVAGVVAILATGAVAGVALAVTGEQDRAEQFKRFGTKVEGARATSPADLSKQFAVFARPLTPDDIPSAEVAGIDAIRSGADLASARRLANDEGETVYAIPVQDGVCLSSESLVVSMCQPTLAMSEKGADAVKGVAGTVCSPFLEPDTATLAGLVADGVRTVSMEFDNGKSTDVSVADNLFLAKVPRQGPAVVQLRWTDSDGKVLSAASQLPRDMASDKCARPDVASNVEQAQRMAREEAQRTQ